VNESAQGTTPSAIVDLIDRPSSASAKDVDERPPDEDSNDAARWALLRGRRSRTIFAAVSYLVVSYVVLYPILVTPVVADDYTNPFIQADRGGASVLDGLEYGWRGATEGASFRIVGNTAGSFANWLIVYLSATFDVGISSLYAGLKFVMIMSCAAAVAWCWSSLTQLVGRPLAFPRALGFVSLTLFTTLQIHAYWSNDPVGNYPLVGFGSTALAFVFLTLVLRFVYRPTPPRAFVATCGAVIAVGYYELNVGAVMGAGIVLALFIVRRWPDRDVRWRAALGSLAIVMIPAALILYGRTVTGGQAETYGGTTVRLGRVAVETFGQGVLSSLPGAAWGLSIRTLGGTLGMVWLAVGVVALLAGISFVWLGSYHGHDDGSNDEPDRWMLTAFVLAVITYWIVAVGLQAVTVKVQDEVVAVGYVYTSYAVGAAAVALGLAAGIRVLSTRRAHWRYFGPVLLVLCTVFVLIQLTVNWRLSEQLNALFVPNRLLLDAFDDDAPVPERCQALQNWTAGGWPDYYEVGMIEGLEVTYRYYFGEPFCDGFNRPP